MMIAVQESTAQVVIPLGISVGYQLYTLINDLHLYVVPFIVMMISEIAKAKSSGNDEGSAAIVALKNIDINFYSMFFVMMLFFIPLEMQTNTSFKSYQCSVNGRTETVDKGFGLPNVGRNPDYGEVFNNVKVAVGWGVANQLFVGAVESVSGSVPCDPDQAGRESELAKSLIKVYDKKLISSSKAFYKQCFHPAIDRVANAVGMNNGTANVLSEPYNTRKNYFFGDNAFSGYRGTNQVPNVSGLNIMINESDWSGSGSSFTQLKTNQTLSESTCLDASKELKKEYGHYLNKHNKHEIDIIYNTDKLYRNKDGLYPTRNSVIDDYSQQAFLDAVTNKDIIVSRDLDNVGNSVTKTVTRYWNGAKDTTMALLSFLYKPFEGSYNEDGVKELDNDTLDVAVGLWHTVSLSVDRFDNNLQSMALYAYLPLLISASLAALYTAIPLLVLISGFSWDGVKNILLVMFYLTTSYYALNIAYFFESLLTTLANSEFSSSYDLGTEHQLIMTITNMVAIVTLVIWTVMCSMCGMKLGPVFSAMFGSSAIGAGKNASGIAKGAAKAAAKAL